MKILTILIPFAGCIGWLAGLTLIQWLSNPQAAPGGVQVRLLFVQTTKPSAALTVPAVLPEGLMNLINELQGQVQKNMFAVLPEQLQVVTHGECVGPQVAARLN
jgi:hypothetical protein